MDIFYLIFDILYTLLSLLGNSGHLTWGKAAATARLALPSPTSACWVVSCFRNPLNSDMDYRIFNMHTWSFLCVRIHTGVEHTDESAQHFSPKKTHKFFLCTWRGSNQGSLDLESGTVPIEPPHQSSVVDVWRQWPLAAARLQSVHSCGAQLRLIPRWGALSIHCYYCYCCRSARSIPQSAQSHEKSKTMSTDAGQYHGPVDLFNNNTIYTAQILQENEF